MFVHPPVHLYAPCMFVHPHMFIHPPVCLYSLLGVYTPQGAPCFCAPAWFWHIAFCGGVVFFCFMCIGTHHPYLGVPPTLLHPPHSIVGSLCIVILRDISSYVGLFPLLLKGLGVFPLSLGEVGVTHQ